jgi:hypothetical protein
MESRTRICHRIRHRTFVESNFSWEADNEQSVTAICPVIRPMILGEPQVFAFYRVLLPPTPS